MKTRHEKIIALKAYVAGKQAPIDQQELAKYISTDELRWLKECKQNNEWDETELQALSERIDQRMKDGVTYE